MNIEAMWELGNVLNTYEIYKYHSACLKTINSSEAKFLDFLVLVVMLELRETRVEFKTVNF